MSRWHLGTRAGNSYWVKVSRPPLFKNIRSERNRLAKQFLPWQSHFHALSNMFTYFDKLSSTFNNNSEAVSVRKQASRQEDLQLWLLLPCYLFLDLLLDREEWSTAFLRNVGWPLPDHGMRQYSSVQGNLERIKRNRKLRTEKYDERERERESNCCWWRGQQRLCLLPTERWFMSRSDADGRHDWWRAAQGDRRRLQYLKFKRRNYRTAGLYT
jgi:hypothetical protein